MDVCCKVLPPTLSGRLPLGSHTFQCSTASWKTYLPFVLPVHLVVSSGT